MTTKTEIISDAFTNLGRGAVSDIDPSSAEPVVVVALQKYEVLVKNYLGKSPWRFAMLTRDLNLLVDKPPIKRFSQAFQLPADYLNMRELRPRGAAYRIYEDKIYINSNEVQIDYTARVDESRFSAQFELFMGYRLAADLAMPVTQNINIQQGWAKAARVQLIEALFQDSQQQPNDVIDLDPIVAAHFGSIRRAF